MTNDATEPHPSARPPADSERAAWNALSREEQRARYRQVLLAPEAKRVSNATMSDVLATVRQRATAGRD